MTAQENATLVQSAYEAFGKGDVPAVLAVMAPDIAWHIPGRSLLAGEYTGPQEVLGFFGKLHELSGGSFRLEVHDLLASDDHVTVLVNEIAHREDRAINAAAVHVWHVSDGKATEFWGTAYDAYALDEFWT